MFYVPAKTIPGKLAFIRLDFAQRVAMQDNTYVTSEDDKIIKDYRVN